MKSRAFTLIEILVVVAIIGILSSVVLAAVNTARENARIKAGLSFAAQIDRVAGEKQTAQIEFNECAGSTASDSSGNASTATLAGSWTWSTDTPTGKGCSLSLTGGGFAPTTKTLSQYMSGTEGTISVWIKPTGTPSGVALPYSGQLIVTDIGWMGLLRSNASGIGDRIFAYNWDTNADYVSTTYQNDKWTHLAWVHAGGMLSLYKDGALVGSTPSGATGSMGTIVTIGGHPMTASFFSGQIDGVHIFSKALTASEIQKQYAETLPMHLATQE